MIQQPKKKIVMFMDLVKHSHPNKFWEKEEKKKKRYPNLVCKEGFLLINS